MPVDSERLRELPQSPGCYIFRNAEGNEIYVGKAKDLRKRVSSYFQESRAHPQRTRRLTHEACRVDVIETGSEVEALLLENRLIKELQPRYNVNLKDDKEYPLLAITREDFPRIFITRNAQLPGVDYYGPFASATQLRQAYHCLMRVFQFRVCELQIRSDDPQRRWYTPCLNFHIKRCSAPCTLAISKERYQEDIRALRSFLSGRGKGQVIDEIRQRMQEASGHMRYEDAARYRDQLTAIASLEQRGRLRDWDTRPAPVIVGDVGAQALCKALSLSQPPRLIEGFDIAHFMGEHVVASMVQFIDGVPHKEAYRRYRIRGQAMDQDPGNNDYAAMQEVVRRRYLRLRSEGRALPDILLIDGGAGQVTAAMQALSEAAVSLPCVIGLAKREERIIRSDGETLLLSRRNPGLKLLQYIRDEAHRFSRRYLHLLQGKKLTGSSSSRQGK